MPPASATAQSPAADKQSKAESQQRWLQKPENRDYFRGAEHIAAGEALASGSPRLLAQEQTAGKLRYKIP